jgi:CHRD domain-containing protein
MSRRSAVGLALTSFVAIAVAAAAVAGQKDSASSTRALFGVLEGSKEVGGGDPDGFGSATGVVTAADTVCFALVVKRLDPPVAAHIHSAQRGVNGPVVVPLTAPTSGDPGTSSGCVSGLDTALVDNLLEHPARYYWNVHTTAYPGGAIRGQLFNKPKPG